MPPPQPVIRLLSTTSAPGDLELNRFSSVCGGGGARSKSGSPLQPRDSRNGSPIGIASKSGNSPLSYIDPVCQWTQTELTLPPLLPPSLENELAKYGKYDILQG